VLPDEGPVVEPPLEGQVIPVPEARMTPLRAAVEVVLCSDYVTQLAIAGLLARAGIEPLDPQHHLSARFVYLLSGIDAVVLLTLVFALLRLSGDRVRDVFLRRGKTTQELSVGVILALIAFGIVMVMQLGIHVVAPFLRNVPENPFQSLLGSPLQIASFVVLVLIAGGVREELQRAFLLHRFEQSLGGAGVGLVVTSAAFGLGHTLQGWDAAVVTGLLGALWGAVYLWRRNVTANIVSHALFNIGEVLLSFAAFK